MSFFQTKARKFLAVLRSVSIAEALQLSFLVMLFLPVCNAMAATQPGSSPMEPSAAFQSSLIINGSPDLLFGLFIGVIITAALYMFFIWIVIRDRGQIFLLFLLLCLGVNMVSSNDSMVQLIRLDNEQMRALLQSYSIALVYFFSLFFTYYFLEVDTTALQMKIPLFLLGSLLAVLIALTAFNRNPVEFVLPTVGVLSITVVLLTGLVAIQAGASGVLSHIIAFSALLIGSLTTPLYELGYIPDPDTAKNYSYLGYSIAAMMFAIVIAGQFAARQEEKEKALEISNERFSLAARGSNEGLFDWDRKTNNLYVSDQFRRIVGLSIDQTPKNFKAWMKRVLPNDRLAIMKILRKLRSAPGSSTISFEYRILFNKTERRWIHTKMVAVKSHASGSIIRLVGSIGDITLSKRSEYELRASEIRFRSITEANPVPVMISRLADNQILYASPGAESLLGLSNTTLISNTLDRFLARYGERNEIVEAIKAGQDVNMKEVVLSRGNGESLAAALSARQINYRNESAMAIGIYDLTERKKAEAQIAQQQEALQQSEKMAALGGLLAGVAHELNNPLSVVMGQTTLLIEGQGEPKIKTRAEKIFKAADRCSRIVKSFLALARRKPPEHKDVDVNTLITGAVELLGYQFRNESVELTLQLDPSLPRVIGDDDQLTQVFMNLALNAAQAMHDWQGTHKITIKTECEGNINVLISFIDTGPGIPPDIRKKIFEPFFTTKGGLGGTGVGLALCLNIVESHGGRVTLEDTPGGGATFRIRMPVSTNKPQVSAEKQPLENKETSGKLRILLVDDEVELAQTLADLLEPAGHDIDLAANGAIALEKLQKTRFDAIISDLRMPVLDGPGMYAKMAETMPHYLTRIIYVTGDTLSPHVNSFLSETPVPVIEKPYRLADVQAALAKLLKENETRSNIGSIDSGAAPVQPST